MPSPVDRYFNDVKEKNPSYSDAQAWATAWSIYCKHKNPGSDHCHKDESEYLKGKEASVIVAVASRFKEAQAPGLAQRVAARFKQAADEEFTDAELAVMSLLDMLKPAARGEDMERAGLGAYHPDNPTIKSLIKKGLVKLQGGTAITLDKAKARKVMKEHEAPAKYKSFLTNPSMQFKRRGE